jgi:hypothetical protein
MRENFKSGSVRGLIVSLEPILQQKVDYEPYSTEKKTTPNKHFPFLAQVLSLERKCPNKLFMFFVLLF